MTNSNFHALMNLVSKYFPRMRAYELISEESIQTERCTNVTCAANLIHTNQICENISEQFMRGKNTTAPFVGKILSVHLKEIDMNDKPMEYRSHDQSIPI